MTKEQSKLTEKLLLAGVFLSGAVMIAYGFIATELGFASEESIRAVGNGAIVALLVCWMGWRKVHSDRIRDEAADISAAADASPADQDSQAD